MTDANPLSKDAQVSRSPGGNRRCPSTNVLRRDCDCRSCRSRRSQSKGRKGQKAARLGLGLRPEKWKGREGNEESWTAAVRVEVKSGKQVQPIATRYLEARAQSDAARARGDFRPFVYVAAPDGSQPLAVIRTDELEAVVSALIEEWSDQ